MGHYAYGGGLDSHNWKNIVLWLQNVANMVFFRKKSNRLWNIHTPGSVKYLGIMGFHGIIARKAIKLTVKPLNSVSVEVIECKAR